MSTTQSIISGSDEEWIKSAISNDSIVANFLINLNKNNKTKPNHIIIHLPNWTVRQRRSKTIQETNTNINKTNTNTNTNRDSISPSTPLSFSAATSSLSGSGEDSTLRLLSHQTRSKVNGDSDKTASKRSRKKKTLPELREEEKLLVKERRELKRELTALHMKLDKQKSTNERLKRVKLDLQPNSVEPSSLLSNDVNGKQSTASDRKFALPDLNMPFDDLSADVTCRVG